MFQFDRDLRKDPSRIIEWLLCPSFANMWKHFLEEDLVSSTSEVESVYQKIPQAFAITLLQGTQKSSSRDIACGQSCSFFHQSSPKVNEDYILVVIFHGQFTHHIRILSGHSLESSNLFVTFLQVVSQQTSFMKGWRRYKKNGGFVSCDGRMSQDFLQVLSVFFNRNMLASRATGETGVV
jgi:hypothetical protein